MSDFESVAANKLRHLEARYDILRNEYHICKSKLDSKCEALLILSKELDQCRSERDQFKLMAEQLQERHQAIKKHWSGKGSSMKYKSSYTDTESQYLAKMLSDTRDESKLYKVELEDLRQKLQDAQGDIKLLREQITRQRVGTTDEGINTRHFPAHEREDLVKQLEAAREQYNQLERDLQQVLDEKEELVTERDVYKMKHERLNQELNYVLKGDENRIVDIDALVMENKYLQDRLKQMEEEKTMAMATVSKYKSILEKKKTKGILKLGQGRGTGGRLVMSQKQVHQILTDEQNMVASPQAMADMRALASALLETINDKSLALSHQRKTNKILGNRVAELEKKLKTLEVSGLWNVPGNVPHLEKMREECENLKSILPRQFSEQSECSQKTDEDEDRFDSITPLSSSESSPVHEPSSTRDKPVLNTPLGINVEDLDLLPTKETSHVIPKDPGKDVSHSAGDSDVLTDTDEENEEGISDEIKTLMEDMTSKLKGLSSHSLKSKTTSTHSTSITQDIVIDVQTPQTVSSESDRLLTSPSPCEPTPQKEEAEEIVVQEIDSKVNVEC